MSSSARVRADRSPGSRKPRGRGSIPAGDRPTFVIISRRHRPLGRLHDGFAAVIVSHGVNILTPEIGTVPAMLVAVAVAVAASFIPGLVNGLLIARLRVPPFIGTLGMYGVARGVAYLWRAAPPCRSTTPR